MLYPSVLAPDAGIAGGLDGARVRRAGAGCAAGSAAAVLAGAGLAGAGFDATGLGAAVLAATGLGAARFAGALAGAFGASACVATCGFAAVAADLGAAVVAAACLGLATAVGFGVGAFLATGFGFATAAGLAAGCFLATAGCAAGFFATSAVLVVTGAVLGAVGLGDSTLGFAAVFRRAAGLGLATTAGFVFATGLALGAGFADGATWAGADADACSALTDTNGNSIAERVKICIIFIWLLTA
ncbi:hypothetical protein [Ruegeria sp. R14_0]|uniref:hypothetical protein n=1 Tax=Ruegeria sp. R14_0 TaxID=2821100 RepID=UPI001ADB7064|nr:hypothetical protein [Ruegeria sp. R14_0]MBO9446211.1 hypothetical protein [Ruegeria sp. R14_0]